MGNGNSIAITINLDRNNLFYFCGEFVSGTVGLNIIEGKVEANEIYIVLTGEIGYTTTGTAISGIGRTTTPGPGRFARCAGRTSGLACGTGSRPR